MSDPTIQVGVADGQACVRLVGRMTFAGAGDMRAFCLRMLDRGVTRFMIDAGGCESMDSTFIGVLALVSMRAGKRHGTVAILNAGDRVESQLKGLGLQHLFQFREVALEGRGWQGGETLGDVKPTDRTEVSRTMLEAHETLCEVDPANIPKFKDVVRFLKEDLESRGGKG
jgi:anti-anti-sigma factor